MRIEENIDSVRAIEDDKYYGKQMKGDVFVMRTAIPKQAVIYRPRSNTTNFLFRALEKIHRVSVH